MHVAAVLILAEDVQPFALPGFLEGLRFLILIRGWDLGFGIGYGFLFGLFLFRDGLHDFLLIGGLVEERIVRYFVLSKERVGSGFFFGEESIVLGSFGGGTQDFFRLR